MRWLGLFVVITSALACLAIFAATPPEPVDHLECSIFEALPVLQEVRPFLDEPRAPDNADFKLRVSYVQDWNQRRAQAAARLDRLITACQKSIDAQQKRDD